jgi:hypothetical protein
MSVTLENRIPPPLHNPVLLNYSTAFRAATYSKVEGEAMATWSSTDLAVSVLRGADKTPVLFKI